MKFETFTEKEEIYNPLCKFLLIKLTFTSWRNYSETLLEKIINYDLLQKDFNETNSSDSDNNELKSNNEKKIISPISKIPNVSPNEYLK